MKKYKAFLFDLNGTMIDDMQYHISAWHRIINDLGQQISIERMKQECYGKNSELLERMFPERFSEAEKERMSREKETQYQQAFRPKLQLLPGLRDFLEKAHEAGIKMAIGSAAIMFNIDFVLDGLGIRKYISAIVSADDVTHSKPHPETYLECARLLGIAAEDCLVLEDVPKGVEAARNAGMDAAVILTTHTREEFADDVHVVAFGHDFTAAAIQKLLPEFHVQSR